jgi:hypothetical protein
MNDATEVKPRRTLRPRITPKQRRAARIIYDIATGERTDIQNTGDIVIEAGYAATIKDTPHKVLDNAGVQMALDELGFNELTAKNVVKQILTSNTEASKDRLKAADMVFKVHGTYAAEKHVSLNVELDGSNERLLELAERLRNGAK